MKKHVIPLVFSLIALALCCTMSLGWLLFGPASPGANEILAAAPALLDKGGQVNDHFLDDLSQYTAHRFFGRQEWITRYAKLNAALFGTSIREDVILGRDGWLYYASTLADFTGSQPMTEEELLAAANNLALMQEYCQSQGADFAFLGIPNKNTLYTEHMPDFPAAEVHDLDRLYALLADTNVNRIDLQTAFRAQPDTLYFAHDSHWNSRGAALGADRILEAFGKDGRYFSDSFSAAQPHTGDLYEMLYPAGEDSETDPVYGGSLQYTFAKNSGRKPDSITIRTESEADGALVMFRDSFGNLLFPYLADSFGTALFSRSTAYDLRQAESGSSVVVELVERNLRYLIQNTPVMPAPMRTVPASSPTGSIALQKEAYPSFPGYRLWTGNADSDGSVVLCAGENGFACFRNGSGGFSAWIPEALEIDTVLFENNGLQSACSVQ